MLFTEMCPTPSSPGTTQPREQNAQGLSFQGLMERQLDRSTVALPGSLCQPPFPPTQHSPVPPSRHPLPLPSIWSLRFLLSLLFCLLFSLTSLQIDTTNQHILYPLFLFVTIIAHGPLDHLHCTHAGCLKVLSSLPQFSISFCMQSAQG